jgi:hypothetical protein
VSGLAGRAVTAVLGACCIVGLACAGGRSKAAAPPTAQDAHAGAGQPAAHEQIEALDRQISDELARAQVTPPLAATCAGPACAVAMTQPFATPVTTDAACHPARSERCGDACTLSTSICGNQQKICDLARQLEGDDWAANKCATARASCQAAHDNCCSCVL